MTRRLLAATAIAAGILILALALAAAITDEAVNDALEPCGCETCQPTHALGDFAPYCEPDFEWPPLSAEDLALLYGHPEASP